MTAHVVAQAESPTAAGTTGGDDAAATGATSGADADTEGTRTADSRTNTGAGEAEAAERIVAMRERIDEIDNTLIRLWQERAALSRQVGATRVASGGTRLVLSREREILDHFRTALGADGTQLALLLLRAGRGPL